MSSPFEDLTANERGKTMELNNRIEKMREKLKNTPASTLTAADIYYVCAVMNPSALTKRGRTIPALDHLDELFED